MDGSGIVGDCPPPPKSAMGRRLTNRRLVDAEAHAAARIALEKLYHRGFLAADEAIPRLQIESNQRIVAAIPGWQRAKGAQNAYIMLEMPLSGTLKPIVITLEHQERMYQHRPSLTYRELHQQVRSALSLEPKVSMRLRSQRPWCRYMTDMPIPEQRALPAHDGKCMHLLGTTLACYLYVHLTDSGCH